MTQGAFWVRSDTAEHRVDIAGSHATVDGGEPRLEVVEEEPGIYLVSNGESRTRVFVVDTDDVRQVFVEGAVYEFEVEAVGRPRGSHRAHHGDHLSAPMPARVVKLQASVGQSVTKGDVLVTLEAMKMELAVRAPRDGVVRSVACRPGELVQPGVPLLEIG